MRSMSARHDPPPLRRDPAPSRWSYRAQRLWLTAGFRRFCRVWLPIGAVMGAIGLYATNPDNVRAVTDTAAELRREIESRPEFQVSVIGIDGASAPLAEEIRLVMGVRLPTSSFDLDLDDLRARVAALPAVASADLRIRTGGYLAVDVVERQPALLWQTRGGAVLLDETGMFVAALVDRPATAPLPIVAGEGADLATPEALVLHRAASAVLGPDLRGLVRMNERRWDVVLEDGRRVLLPAEAPQAALRRVLDMHEADDLFGRDILRVDMRNPTRPTFQLSPEAIAELRRQRAAARGEAAADDEADDLEGTNG